MKVITGNLLLLAEAGAFDAIVQGCNCFVAQGSGIAGQLRKYPQVLQADVGYSSVGDTCKLGHFSVAEVTYKKLTNLEVIDGVRTAELENPFEVVNAYTQYQPGPDFIPSIFPFLLQKLNVAYAGKRLGFPRIGCGIGGGDWEYVEDMLLRHLPDVEVTVVVYG